MRCDRLIWGVTEFIYEMRTPKVKQSAFHKAAAALNIRAVVVKSLELRRIEVKSSRQNPSYLQKYYILIKALIES